MDYLFLFSNHSVIVNIIYKNEIISLNVFHIEINISSKVILNNYKQYNNGIRRTLLNSLSNAKISIF